MAGILDAIVVGGGPTGLAAALLVADTGRSVALLAPSRPADERTTALLAGAGQLFERLGVWADITEAAAPLRHIRVVDATGGLFRAPETLFSADEIGLEAFGYNLSNRRLGEILDGAIASRGLRRLGQMATAFSAKPDAVTVTLSDGAALSARLVIAADGRNSAARTAAGITVKSWTYDQAALVLNLAHRLDHEDVSTEFHTPDGPFTLVPLPGRRSSLVWVTRPREAARLRGLSDAALATEIERKSQSLLGAVSIDGPRQTFPISGLSAERLAASRTVLIGEAGHVLPPIGAQGLNLGLRDVAAIEALLTDHGKPVPDPGAPAMLQRYERLRHGDVSIRTGMVGALNQSLLDRSLPGQVLRAGGLSLLGRIGPLRRTVMRQGLAAI